MKKRMLCLLSAALLMAGCVELPLRHSETKPGEEKAKSSAVSAPSQAKRLVVSPAEVNEYNAHFKANALAEELDAAQSESKR